MSPRFYFNYASAGSASHFAGLLFAKIAGIDIVHVPYKGGAPAIAEVLAGGAAFNAGSAWSRPRAPQERPLPW